MSVAVALLFVISWRETAGYDYAASCARSYRSGRARPPEVPCDLSKQSYCTTPGENYPWQAIRSFIRANQGLMKRMYGEELHISILKAQLNNFIDDGDDSELIRKNNNFNDDVFKAKMMYTKGRSRVFKDNPHFRPIKDKNRKSNNNEPLSVKPLEKNATRNNNTVNNNERNEVLEESDKAVSYKTKLESIANIEINDLEPNVITLEAVIKQSIETNSIHPKHGGYKTDNDKNEQIVKNITISTSQKDNITMNTENTTTTETTTETQYDTTTTSEKDAWKPMSGDTSTLPPTLLFSVHKKIDRIDTNTDEKREEFIQKPIPERPAVISLGGANACETRMELVAPFWANNTRSEKLVLLNMYPYEQYIQMETCVHELKQMYCREGCRCEQQYRLHRLLAYDPENECRGIFADWFKFPSCCVCKCYDVPVEFRSRSPRILPPQYGEEIKRIIYDDVARDWYSAAFDENYDFY